MATDKRLIDANALIESGYDVTLDKVFPDWDELPDSTKEAVCKHGQYLKKMINELPSVDAVEVVYGRWVGYHEADIGYDEYGVRCSNCNFEVEDHEVDFIMNYCPNCGAKMDGDRNG